MVALGCRFRAAAEHNHASAQYGLGYMHLVGHGVAMNHRKAYKHFSSAAEQARSTKHARHITCKACTGAVDVRCTGSQPVIFV